MVVGPTGHLMVCDVVYGPRFPAWWSTFLGDNYHDALAISSELISLN